MAVRLDVSARSVLVACDQCPWLELVTAPAIARRVGLEHLWAVHPDELDAINVQHVAQHRRRVADAKA